MKAMILQKKLEINAIYGIKNGIRAMEKQEKCEIIALAP